MCGIFGLSGNFSYELTNKIIGKNTDRGDRGFGLYIVTGDNKHIIFKGDDVHSIKSISNIINSAKYILGHTLAPTGYYKYYHPLEVGDFVFAHNGILLNTSSYPESKTYPHLDSGYFAGQLYLKYEETSDVIPSLVKTIEMFDGQMGCWLTNKDDDYIYIWRNMSTVYYGKKDEAAYFSSVLISKTDRLLDEGIIYNFSDSMNILANFRSKSIYKT